MICKSCRRDFPHRTGSYCGGCQPTAPLDVICADVEAELVGAKARFPEWPTDPLHAVAVLNEEVGELNKAILQATYESHNQDDAIELLNRVEVEAVQVAAMALRFLESLAEYHYSASRQHRQSLNPCGNVA